MCQHPPDGPISPGSARPAPAIDGAQTGQSLGETAAGLALRATRYLCIRFRERIIVGDLPTHLAYSPSHLTRVFTSVVGTSPMDYLAAWRLHEAKHLLITRRLGVTETCHEVGYTSVGILSRRFLRDVGTPPGSLRGIADRVVEWTQLTVSPPVPAAGRICIRLDTPEGTRRTFGSAPYQWVDISPRLVPSGLPTSGSLHRHTDEVELLTVSDSPWILTTIFPDGVDVHGQLAPTNPLAARLCVPEGPVSAPVTSPVRAAFPWDPAVLAALAATMI